VNRERSLVQVAFELKARLPNEFFVFRLVLAERLFAEAGESTDGLQVEVENCVGAGEKPRGLGCGSLSKVDRESNGGNDQGNRQQNNEIPRSGPHKWGTVIQFRRTDAKLPKGRPIDSQSPELSGRIFRGAAS